MRSNGRKNYQHPFAGVSAKYNQFAGDAERLPTERRAIVEDLKTRFDTINARAIQRGDAWLTSVPGDMVVTLECLPGSVFPDDLRDKGYQLREEPPGERILPHAITEKFCRRVDGVLEPLTEGSTAPIVHVRTHAGPSLVERYSFLL